MKFQPVFSLHVFQSYIHHMINMLFSVLLKMFKKNKMAHLFVNINFGFKFRYWLAHAFLTVLNSTFFADTDVKTGFYLQIYKEKIHYE